MGYKKKKKILLTNKKWFIRPGLWFFWGARRKYLAFSNRMKKGSIPMKTLGSVSGSVIFLISTLSSLTSSSSPCLYTSYYSNFLFSPVANLPLSSFFTLSPPPRFSWFLSCLFDLFSLSESINLPSSPHLSFRLSLFPAGLSWQFVQLGITCVFINAVHGRVWTTTGLQREDVWVQHRHRQQQGQKYYKKKERKWHRLKNMTTRKEWEVRSGEVNDRWGRARQVMM